MHRGRNVRLLYEDHQEQAARSKKAIHTKATAPSFTSAVLQECRLLSVFVWYQPCDAINVAS
jgi:hypothetical protein